MVKTGGIKDFGNWVRFMIFILTAIFVIKANPIHGLTSDAALKTFSKIAFFGAGTTYLGMVVISLLLWTVQGYTKIGILETKEGSVQMGASGFAFSAALLAIGFVLKLIINIR